MPKPVTDDVINRLLNQTPQSIESILNPQPIQPVISQGPRELSELRISSFIGEWELIPKPKPVTYDRDVQTDPISFEAP